MISQVRERNGLQGIDWDKVAAFLGVPTGAAASLRWSRLQRNERELPLAANERQPMRKPATRGPRNGRKSGIRKSHVASLKGREKQPEEEQQAGGDARIHDEELLAGRADKIKTEPVEDLNDAADDLNNRDVEMTDEPVESTEVKIKTEPIDNEVGVKAPENPTEVKIKTEPINNAVRLEKPEKPTEAKIKTEPEGDEQGTENSVVEQLEALAVAEEDDDFGWDSDEFEA